jgi:DNA-binding GntR family transcriptional regulator
LQNGASFVKKWLMLQDFAGMITKTVLSDQIIEVVRKRIIAGGFDIGAPIRQDALAAELGVSKIPLREAFAKLEQEGLIVSRANRGYCVSPLSIEEALDVFDLRLKLEPAATADACALLDEEEIDAARRALALLDESIAASDSSAGELNREFHVALIQPCRRPVTVQIIERLHFVSERYTVKHLEGNGRNSPAAAEHHALFAAWAAGQCERVKTLAAEHIRGARDSLAPELRAASAF